MNTAFAFLVGFANLIIVGYVHAVESEGVVAPLRPLRVTQLWEYPVALVCLLLLVPAFTSAYWSEALIQKLTGKR